jgi:hypothetical protein
MNAVISSVKTFIQVQLVQYTRTSEHPLKRIFKPVSNSDGSMEDIRTRAMNNTTEIHWRPETATSTDTLQNLILRTLANICAR